MLKLRPAHLRKGGASAESVDPDNPDSDSDNDFLDLKTERLRGLVEQESIEEEGELLEELEDVVAEVEEDQDTADTPPRRQGLRPRPSQKQASPKQRKKRQSVAKFHKPAPDGLEEQ